MRLLVAVIVALTPIVAGARHRSPWVVALFAPVFTALYAAGRWAAWRAAWRGGGLRAMLASVATALPIQALLVGAFYLIGLGLGSLSAPRPTAPLSETDVWMALVLLAVGLASSLAIVRLEAGAAASAAAHAAGRAADEVQLSIDPTPLTPQSFFVSPGYWRANAASDALERRGGLVEKRPLAASEEMLAAAERRLGVQLPDTLRALYRIMDGGYVGKLYVPLKGEPGPRYDDWRGAFSIDYSSLAALDQLRTVAEHYADFTDDPDDLPKDADRLVVLQARYGDMTLLDYSGGPEPRVLIVDYDRAAGKGPVDATYEDFDTFFRALRRERDDFRPFRREAFRSLPLASLPEAERPRAAWMDDRPHPFFNMASSRQDGSEPKRRADDALVAETEARLGLPLPPALVALWRWKNGGEMAYVYLDAPDSPDGERRAWTRPIPLEYVVSLETLSGRIRLPPGVTPWAEKLRDARRLVVLEADHDRALLLDYREGTNDPAVLIADDLSAGDASAYLRVESVDEFFRRLRRFQRLGQSAP